MIINKENFEWAYKEVLSYDTSEKMNANPTQYLDLMMSFIRYFRKGLDKDVFVMDLVKRLACGVQAIYLNSIIDGSYGREGMLGDVQRYLANYKDSIPTKEECEQFSKEHNLGDELDYYDTKEQMCVSLGRLYHKCGDNFDYNEAQKLCLYYYDIAIDIHKKGLIDLSHMVDMDYTDYDEVKENLNFNWGVPDEKEPDEKPPFNSEYRNGKYVVIDDEEPSPSSIKIKPILIGVAVVVVVISLISLFGNSNTDYVEKLSRNYWLEDNSSDLWDFSNGKLHGTGGTYNFDVRGGKLILNLSNEEATYFFTQSSKQVDGEWDIDLSETSFKLKEIDGKGRTLSFTKLSVSDLYNLGNVISNIWGNNIKGDFNFASITGNTKKSQMKIPSEYFDQIGSGPGYKVYSVYGNRSDYGDKCIWDYDFYKINDWTQKVEVMGVSLSCPNGQYSKAVSDKLRDKLEGILSSTMLHKTLRLGIGSEGFSCNGFVSWGENKRNSYAIAYNEGWIAIVVGFNEKSFKNFIGIE